MFPTYNRGVVAFVVSSSADMLVLALSVPVSVCAGTARLRFASLRFASGRVDVARATDAVWESLVIRYIGGLCRFVCSERVYSGSIILVYVEMYVEMYAQLVVGWMRVSASSMRVSSTYTYARMHVSSTYTYVYPS